MKAVILAGGLGSRLRPYTDKTPKPLLPIAGKPIVEHVIDNLVKHGVDEIILSIGYKADMIKEYFGDGSSKGISIKYNVEDEGKLLGTGGAVKEIVSKFDLNREFLLLWVDNPADYDINKLIEVYSSSDASVAMTLTQREDVENFGVATIEGEKILGFVEKPKRGEALSNWINAGAFVIHPSALKILPDGKSSIEKDCFEKLAGEGKLQAHFHKGYWFPTDTVEKYHFAEKKLKNLAKT